MKAKILFFLLFISITVLARGGDTERMLAKIRVQEKIIDTMIEGETSFTVSPETEGIYIDGFGAIFTVQIIANGHGFKQGMLFELPNIHIEAFEEANKALEEVNEALKQTQEAIEDSEKAIEKYYSREITQQKLADDYESALQKSREEKIEKNRKKFAEQSEKIYSLLKNYIADYGPIIMLPNGETLMLRGYIESYKLLDEGKQNFEIVTNSQDLYKLHSSAITREQFFSNLSIKKYYEAEAVPGDILIMKNILKTAFENRKCGGLYFNIVEGENTWGTYIPGFGALFIQNYSSPGVFSFSSDGEETRGTFNIFINNENDTCRTQEVDDMETELSELLITYSPTLKSVKPQEQVVVAVKFNNRFGNNKNQVLILKGQKKIFLQDKSEKEIKKSIEVVKF